MAKGKNKEPLDFNQLAKRMVDFVTEEHPSKAKKKKSRPKPQGAGKKAKKKSRPKNK